MKRWEQLAADIGQRYVDARERVRAGVEEVVGSLADERTAHERLTSEFVVDRTWAGERAAKVASRLNAERAGPPLAAAVLWASGLQAFTLPGRWIYVTRELMEQLPSEGALAFVLAHEMAHHDLGHLSIDPKVTRALGNLPLAADAALVAKHALMVWARPEWELAADAEGARLVVRCGYRVEDALDALRTLERWALDHGQLDVVFGGEAGAFSEWFRQRRTGYLSLRDRMDALRRTEP